LLFDLVDLLQHLLAARCVVGFVVSRQMFFLPYLLPLDFVLGVDAAQCRYSQSLVGEAPVEKSTSLLAGLSRPHLKRAVCS